MTLTRLRQRVEVLSPQTRREHFTLPALPTDWRLLLETVSASCRRYGHILRGRPLTPPSFVSRRSTPTALYEGCARVITHLSGDSMTCAEIISKFETYVDDNGTLNRPRTCPPEQNLPTCVRRSPGVLKKDEGTYMVTTTTITVPSDFGHFVENLNYTDNAQNSGSNFRPVGIPSTEPSGYR